MLDLKEICKNPERIKQGMRDRNMDPTIVDNLVALNMERIALKIKTDELRRIRKQGSQQYFGNIRETKGFDGLGIA